jgi:dolichol-phosphate mannosyltransferase
MQQKLPISIVVPAKNEHAALPKLCRAVAKAMGKQEYEIIVVNDHSTDQTARVARELSREYPVRVHNLRGASGKCAGVLAGVNQAKYEVAAYIDADLQYSPAALPLMLQQIAGGRAEVVVANRLVKAGSYQPSRYARFRNWLYRVLFGLDSDVQSGLKVFKKSYLQNLRLVIKNPWSLDAQFLYFAKRQGARIGGVNITYDARSAGDTKNSRRRLNAYRQIYEALYLWWAVKVVGRWNKPASRGSLRGRFRRF